MYSPPIGCGYHMPSAVVRSRIPVDMKSSGSGLIFFLFVIPAWYDWLNVEYKIDVAHFFGIFFIQLVSSLVF